MYKVQEIPLLIYSECVSEKHFDWGSMHSRGSRCEGVLFEKWGCESGRVVVRNMFEHTSEHALKQVLSSFLAFVLWYEWRQGVRVWHPCRMATNLKLLHLSKKVENALSNEGFRTWNNTIQKTCGLPCSRRGWNEWAHYTKSSSVAVQIAQNLKSDQSQSTEVPPEHVIYLVYCF